MGERETARPSKGAAGQKKRWKEKWPKHCKRVGKAAIVPVGKGKWGSQGGKKRPGVAWGRGGEGKKKRGTEVGGQEGKGKRDFRKKGFTP